MLVVLPSIVIVVSFLPPMLGGLPGTVEAPLPPDLVPSSTGAETSSPCLAGAAISCTGPASANEDVPSTISQKGQEILLPLWLLEVAEEEAILHVAR